MNELYPLCSLFILNLGIKNWVLIKFEFVERIQFKLKFLLKLKFPLNFFSLFHYLKTNSSVVYIE